MNRRVVLLFASALSGLICAAGLWIFAPVWLAHEVELHVVDANGKPVESFGWNLWRESAMTYVYSDGRSSETRRDWSRVDRVAGGIRGWGAAESAHPDGIAIARVPIERIKIEVWSSTMNPTVVGPIERESLPARLDVVLQDLSVVSGTVTFHGAPVAEAKVMLVVPKGNFVFPSGLLGGFRGYRTTTDELGAFRIGSAHSTVEYYVRASRDGYAAGTAGPVRAGDPPLEVQLHGGGSIEGRVRMPRTLEAHGALIERYRTEPSDHPWSAYGSFIAKADDGGHFRFDHVEAGAWLVRLKPPERKPGDRLQTPPESVPFVVDVAEGETTPLEMDLAQSLARLDGRLLIEGKPWSAASVYLLAIGEPGFLLDIARADAEGRWTLRARVPGKYRARLMASDREPVVDTFGAFVELSPDGQRFQRDFGPKETRPYPSR